jgi:uncharacterized protein
MASVMSGKKRKQAEASAEPLPELPAGDFAPWLAGTLDTIAGRSEADVPCGGCVACCSSYQFVHIAPDETETLAHIPRALLVTAPGAPPGYRLLGYNARGCCPLLGKHGCTIYEHRPRTCRVYDCRIFPAADVLPRDEQVPIARQAKRWRFRLPTLQDREKQAAVRAAAPFLAAHPEVLPPQMVPLSPTACAVLALQIHNLFGQASQLAPKLVSPEVSGFAVDSPAVDVVRAAVERCVRAAVAGERADH